MLQAWRASSLLSRHGEAVPNLTILLAAAMLISVGACSRERSHEGKTLPLPVDVRADTASSVPLVTELPPTARVWVARVTPAPPSGPGPELPDGWRRRHSRPLSIDLDVLVDDTGAVSDVECAGECSDSSLVEAARRCARTMRFYPALRGGWPVAVWCRHRFDFGGK